MNLAFAESEAEIEFIISRTQRKKLIWLPINFETLLYVKSKKLDFIDPYLLFDKNDHIKGILEQEKLFKFLNTDHLNKKEYLINRYKLVLCKYFNSIFLIITFYEKLKKKKYLIEKIYLSGWNNYSFSSIKKNNFITRICENIFINKKIKIIKLEKKKNIKKNFYFRYYCKKIKLTSSFILFSNVHYNFKRFIPLFKKQKMKILYFEFNKLNLLKKIFYYLNGVVPIMVSKKKKFGKIPKIKKIKYKYKTFDLSFLLNQRKDEVLNELNNLNEKFKIIKNFLKHNQPLAFFNNLSRDINGYLSEVLKRMKIKIFTIPHGTLTKSNNKYNKIFQKTLSRELISKNSSYILTQTKILKEFLVEHNLKNKILETGNLIFAETNFSSKRKYILYAVTLRHFINNYYFGIETFFEFFKNLEDFNNLSKKKSYKFLIQLHPNIRFLKKKLEDYFTNLTFSDEPINKSLSKSFCTISFSSTSIEDSLCSKIPVILYDPTNRYMHCKSQKDLRKIGYSIYYLNNIQDLINAINIVKKSKKYNFNQYLFKGNYKENISKFINKYL